METALRQQFLLAAGYEEVDYPTLKAFARNSVAYSFLPAPDRARLLARLDADFDAFERLDVSTAWVAGGSRIVQSDSARAATIGPLRPDVRRRSDGAGAGLSRPGL